MEELPCTQTLVDSGANVTVCSLELVNILQLQMVKTTRPLRIEFANGTVTYSDEYVDLGPFLGLTYVVDNVNTVIASCSKANASGYSMWFTKELTCQIVNTKWLVLQICENKTSYIMLMCET